MSTEEIANRLMESERLRVIAFDLTLDPIERQVAFNRYDSLRYELAKELPLEVLCHTQTQ